MPIYEYYCGECHGVFELLRKVRQAADSQPCVECDTESKRIMSRDFAAFTMRDGTPRLLPDRGTFWHLGKEVSQPINVPTPPNEHQELMPRPPPRAPTVEELEAFEEKTDRRDAARKVQREMMGRPVVNPSEERDALEFTKRMKVRGSQRQEHVKSSLIKKRLGKNK